MYRIFLKDELASKLKILDSHTILNFVQDKIEILTLSKISTTDKPVLYINDLHSYKDYDQFIKHLKKTKIIIDFSYESGTGSESQDNIISHFVSLGIDQQNILFVLNTSAMVNEKLTHFNICFFDYFAADAVRRMSIDTFSQTRVEQRPLRLNLLIAKLKKIPRYLTLYCFYKKSLLDKSILSILASHEDITFHNLRFPDIEEDFYKIIKKYYGPRYDNLSEKYLGRTKVGVRYTGWPNDPRLYDESAVSVICETSERWGGWSSEFITEKTYRTIANRHPFVMQGSPGILKYLKTKGYKTFDKLIDESYDDSKEENIEIVEKVVDVGIDLCKKIPNNLNLIQEIVDHNYNNLVEVGNNETKKLLEHFLRFTNQ
jgi:hypothetical protein